MSSMWTVAPETNRIELEFQGCAFWIEVKRDLTVGEQRQAATAGWSGYKQQQGQEPQAVDEDQRAEVIVNWVEWSLARTLAYLVDWSLADDRGNKLPLQPASQKRDTIKALHSEVYDLIDAAIGQHVERRALEKKVPPGDVGPRAISA